MKILHVSYAQSWGGGEQQMIDLIHALNAIDEVNVLLCYENSDLARYSEKKGLNYEFIKAKGIKELKAQFDNIDPDIIHIHTGNFISDFIKMYVFYGLRKPCIYTINGMMRKKSFFSKLKYNFKGINAYHFVSNAAKEHFKETVAFSKIYDKLHVVYDGIQTDVGVSSKKLIGSYGINKGDFIIGNVANHTRAKSLLIFLKVAQEIIQKRGIKNIHFVQVGRFTKLTTELTDYVTVNRLQKNIHFLNFVPDAELLIPQFSCLLMTSNREGIPLTILEAFKYNIPVVSTTAGGIPEAIVDGENGLLSDVDDYESLADDVLKINNDPILKEQLTAAAHQLFQEKFIASRMAVDTLRLYQNIT